MRFGFHRNVALGRFVPGRTPLHRLDPRTKLLLFPVWIVALWWLGPWGVTALVLGLAGFAAASGLGLARLLEGLKALGWILAITFLFQWLWLGPRQLGGYGPGAVAGVVMVLRLIGLLLAAALLASTTEPIRLADGLARLLRGLERLRVPVRDLALVLSLAVRFLPTVLEEAERIATAQRARGARFEGGLLTRARRYLPLAVPLFAGCLRRADALALAMEARGYRSGAARTQWEPLRWGAADLWTLVVSGIILAGMLLGSGG